ncbi:MAG TPA: gamma-glutamyltransferase [Pirellulales bacterium]|nr:gamma-glutamyltransferase [Pirellulales bacterium]
MRMFVIVVVTSGLLARGVDESAWSSEDASPAALAEGRNGVVVGVSGPAAVHAGLETLKNGGSAADAALATAMAQVVECGGCYVSFAGVLSMVYYEADSGQVHYLNAGFNTPLEENDPLTIPGGRQPSGRTALVPGFLAGVDAAQQRFGKLSRQQVFEPAIELAEQGVKVSPLLAELMQDRKDVLSRLPETRRIFMKEGDALYKAGESFCQPQLAETLRHVAKERSEFIYTGPWAEQFVEAVQKEGGKISLDDMKTYRVTWDEPLRTMHRGYEVCVPGLSSHGGVAMIEALHLVERADLPARGHFSTTPSSLFWLMQISHCQVLDFLPAKVLENFDGLDLSPTSRLKRETADAIWQRMQSGTWPFAAKFDAGGKRPSNHSDGVVVVDRWGNVAAVTHTIHTNSWGHTGLFVGGISIPDAAALLQAAMQETGPGKRLPESMCPLILLKDGQPLLATSTIGASLHQKTLQVLTSVLDFSLAPEAAIQRPSFLMAAFSDDEPPAARVERGKFKATLLDATRALGQEIREVSSHEADNANGYLVGVQIEPEKKVRRAIGARQDPLPAAAEGY